MTPSHERYLQYLETMTPASLERLGDYVAPDVRFRDPFNDVTGVDAMQRIFRHMYDAVGPVTFHVTHAASNGDACLLSWRFEAVLRGAPWSFDGASVVRFDEQGRVCEHIDHWDAARDFYERLPVIGRVLAWLRGRVADG